MKYNWD